MAPSLSPCETLSTLRKAGSDTKDCKGILSGDGALFSSHASVHDERSCRDGLPVHDLDRTVSLDVADNIFSLTTGVVSASEVVSHTEPHHAPDAPMAIDPAICPP